MSHIENLDKVLHHVSLFSQNLASISTTDLSMNTGIDIDELSEYLEELGNRGFVNNHNGSYITLQGRLALENAKNNKPFQEEVESKKLKKYWSITKIVAGVLNALAIIIIAIWTQLSSDKKSKLENDIQELKKEYKIEVSKQSEMIDSLNKITKKLSKENVKLTKELETNKETKTKK
ncbi:hypothetical protein [Pontimicrobium sp. IMCC45349]|uniref:hypothetical protein n=1 Tax=Pontimicrobium sp. IMCC45349 TaxID=3391574 RepID=UPI0039A120C1